MERFSETPLLPEGYSYHSEGYLWHILPEEKFDLPAQVEVNGEVLTKKIEFHVTVANVRAIARELGGTEEEVANREKELQKLLAEYVKDNPIRFVSFEDDLRLAVTPERKSIAARCTMEGVEGYFARIKEVYGREFPLQPAHVSIYTLNGKAIGINSDEQMESYLKVDLPEVQEALHSIRF